MHEKGKHARKMRLKLPFRNSYIKLGNITTSLKIPKKVKTPTKRSFYVVPHKAIAAVRPSCSKKIKLWKLRQRGSNV